MKTFQPKLEVRLIKTARRDVVGLDVPAAKRYASLDAIDLTPYLADSTPVRLGKSVRDASGGWSLMLVDKPVPGTMETLYALIEPMDIIEFRLAHAPFEYRGESGVNKYKLPVVMRGFVSVIARTRSMAGGRPIRTISLSGHDFGKILEILRIYYLNNSAIGDNIIAEMKFFSKYAGPEFAKIMSGAEFVALVLEKVINPYISRLTAGADGGRVESTVIKSITADVSISGTVSPTAIAVFEDGSVHQFLSQFLDAGAFNEMFLEEREDAVALVVRPNPFMDIKNKPIQASLPLAQVMIDDVDVETITESRTDGGVANYYWVTNAGWQIQDNMTMKQLADASPVEQYVLLDYGNCAAGRYGFRKMEVESRMGPPEQEYQDALLKEKKITETDKRMTWLVDRRRILAAQNQDNVVLESGEIHVRGNEKIKAGMYLVVNYGSFSVRYYVTHVQHDFHPFVSFKTIVSFERGNGFIERAQRPIPPYLAEQNKKGAV